MIPMKRTPLSQLASVSAGQGAPKDTEFSEVGVPFVRAGSLEALVAGRNESELELVSAETAKLRKLKTYPKGTILFAKSGMSATKDRIYVLQNPAHVVSHLATLIPKDGVNVDYLRLALKRFPPSSLIKDPAYPAIGLGEIEDFEISVPEEFDDQIRIAHLLGKVEGLIAQRKQHLQQLVDLLKSVFLEMFGDPMSNPKKWPDSGLGDALTFLQYGPRFYNESYSENGIRIVRITDLSESGELDFSEMPRLDVTSEEEEKFLLKPGDLIFARTGATVGKVAIIGPNDPPAIAGAYFIVMRFQPTLLPLYVRLVLTSSSVRAAIADRSRQAAQPNFSGPGLRKLPMPRPPIELQRDFAEIFEAVANLRVRYQRSLAGLQDLYGGLSQQAFKGELDLSRVALPAVPAEGVSPVAVAVPAPITTPVIELPESNLLLPALQDRTQLAPLLHFWLEAYRAQLGSAAFSLERFLAAAQTRLAEPHPDLDFELGVSDYEGVKAWVFDEIQRRRLKQTRDIIYIVGRRQFGNRILLRARRRAQQ
jgi:type I restriction enzyme S subunit